MDDTTTNLSLMTMTGGREGKTQLTGLGFSALAIRSRTRRMYHGDGVDDEEEGNTADISE